MRYVTIVLSLLLLSTICNAGGKFSPPPHIQEIKPIDQWTEVLKNYDCLEVNLFQIDRSDLSTVELRRAIAIADDTLMIIQASIVQNINDAALFSKVFKSNESKCTGKVLLLGGRITDYKEGDQAARILIAIGGVGEQKIQAQCYLKDKASGNVLVEKTVALSNTFFSGNFAGEELFAKRVASFVKEGPTYEPKGKAKGKGR